MPEIEITEDQHEYLEALRQDIKQDVVGKYAHVRMVDAVQYLIDNHEGEINATVSEPSAGPDVSAENAPEGGDAEAADAADTSADEDASADDADADEEAADAETDADESEREEAADDESEADDGEESDEADDADDADTESADDPAGSPPMPTAGGGGDDGMLSAMMQLMDTHDDKWEEASGDTGYEVELPDGSSESAATQDDVRAILFKHYE